MNKILNTSIVELNGRERILEMLDKDTYRELLDPFQGIESPHLAKQNIVPQSDDGVIIAKGKINEEEVVVISIEGEFQGGGIGEVSGAKIAGTLELAHKDILSGQKTTPIILFDTGGVRLQEANYGLLSIAEIQAAIVAIQKHVPVIAVIPGPIGAFGGMSITAGLCNSIIITRQARLGLNGPEVIEQEAGIREFDSKNRVLTFKTLGGAQRLESGFVDALIKDDLEELKVRINKVIHEGKTTTRTEQIAKFERFLNTIEPSQKLTPEKVHELGDENNNDEEVDYIISKNHVEPESRGKVWFDLLRGDAKEIGDIPSVRVADSVVHNQKVRYIAVVPDKQNPFPRTRGGEIGLREGWSIAKHIWSAIEEDRNLENKRIIVPIVDVPSQAFGYNEELIGIHQSCAASVNAYATARLEGHSIIAYIPGNAISGAFLSHGLQSNRLIALRDPGVNVHVMSKQSAALITQRTLEELEEVTKKVPAMAYDIESFKTLGALHALLEGINADNPSKRDRDTVLNEINEAINDIKKNNKIDLSARITNSIAKAGGRTASILVREKLSEQWN